MIKIYFWDDYSFVFLPVVGKRVLPPLDTMDTFDTFALLSMIIRRGEIDVNQFIAS